MTDALIIWSAFGSCWLNICAAEGPWPRTPRGCAVLFVSAGPIAWVLALFGGLFTGAEALLRARRARRARRAPTTF